MFMYSLTHFIPMLPIMPIIALMLKQASFMMSLLCLEAMILMLVLGAAVLMGTTPMMEPFLCLFILVFAACEASLGLSVMVIIMRAYGSDSTKSLTMSKC